MNKERVMSEHIVVNINGGDSFDVKPQWACDGQSGFCVRPAGLDAGKPGSVDEEIVKDQLALLVLYRKVELGETIEVDGGSLVCNVYCKGRNLVDHIV